MGQFNSFQFNTGIYQGGTSLATVHSTDLVVFDGFSLADNASSFVTHLLDSAPTRDILGKAIPRDDGAFVNADFWREKRIEVRGIVKKSTNALLEAYLDTVRKNLGGTEKNLDITRDSGNIVRRYIATLENPHELFADRRYYHNTFCPYVARFVCKTPFATDRDYSSQNIQVTTSPETDGVSYGGTIEGKPIFVLVFNAANSVTAMTVKNDDTGEELTYTGTLSAGDQLEIDSENNTVKLNGTEVDYSGAFPTLNIGDNTIRYTPTGSSWDIRATIKYKNRYL